MKQYYKVKTIFGLIVAFCAACRYNFRNRKLACQRADTIYEDLEAQSDDEMFITNPSKRTVTAESQLDAADDLFDSLLEGHKKEDDKGPLCRDADNSNLK